MISLSENPARKNTINMDYLQILELEHLSLIGIFFIVLLVSLLPTPEELFLIIIGYAASLCDINIFKTIIVSILGLMIADQAWYQVGLRSDKIRERLLGFIGKERVTRYLHLLVRHTNIFIIAARFVPGIRTAGLLTIGSFGTKARHFLFWNAISATVYVILFILLGWFFRENFEMVMIKISSVKHWFFLLALSIVIVSALRIILRIIIRRVNGDKPQ